MPNYNIERIDEIVEEFVRENQENGKQGRKYVVRIDHPQSYKPNPRSNNDLKAIAYFLYDLFKSLTYFYASYGESEEAKTVLYIYLEFNNAIRESTIRNRLPGCHCTQVWGTRKESLKKMYSICEENGYVECDAYDKQFNR